MKNKLFALFLVAVMLFGAFSFVSLAAKYDPSFEDPFVDGKTTVSGVVTTTAKKSTTTKITTTVASYTVAKKIKNFKIKAVSLNSVELSWDKSENATSYKVYRSDGTGAIKLYSSVSVNFFTDKNLSRGKTYSYQVMAVSSGSTGTSRSDYSSVVSYTVLSKKLSSYTITPKSKKALFRVKKISGASGYQVVYSTNKNFKKSKTKTFSSNKFTLKSLKKNKKYYVKIRAYSKVGGKTYYTSYLKKNFKTKK